MTSSKNSDHRVTAHPGLRQATAVRRVTILPGDSGASRIAGLVRPRQGSGASRLTTMAVLGIVSLVLPYRELVGPQKAAAQAATAQADPAAATQLLEKGKESVVRAKAAATPKQRDELLAQARAQLEQARQLLQTSLAEYDKEWKTFGPFIDRAKQPEQFKAKQEVEQKKLRTELHLAILPYQLAQTYAQDKPQQQVALKAAAEKLERLHQKHRSQVIGLYARLYQAKCFEELGEPRKALGIYSELLGHKSAAPIMKQLQTQATHFKLIALNSLVPAESELVDNIAREWIQANPQLLETADGKGIVAEQARALKNRNKPADPATK